MEKGCVCAHSMYVNTSVYVNMQHLPSESILLSAVGGMTDTLHSPSGHFVTKDSLHEV